jgi:hypothetical protein
MPLKPASTFIPSRSPIADKDGMATWSFIKILQGWDTQLQNGLNSQGQIIGDIPFGTVIVGRDVGIGFILQNLDDSGIVKDAGVDFSRAYTNKNTDHINDGAGSPLAGGKEAYTALVTSPPVPVASHWVRGFAGGLFVLSQPSFADLSGTSSAGQIPPLSSLSGQITDGQLPANGLSVTITTAALTTLGTQGSMTFTNGILTGQVQAT